MRKLIILALLFLTLAASAPAQTKRAPLKERVIRCEVVSVTDGDTFRCKNAARVQAIRLLGVDAPESKQPYGAESRAFLDRLIGGKPVVVKWRVRSIGNRPVGRVILGGEDIAPALLLAGSVYYAVEYAGGLTVFRRRAYAAATREAREAGRGVFGLSEDERILPRDWRAGVRTKP